MKVRASVLFIVAACLLDSTTSMYLVRVASSCGRQEHTQWRRGTYLGLTPGRSSRRDVERVFGKPLWKGNPESEPGEEPTKDVMYEYEDVGGLKGRTSVIFGARSGLIKVIYLYPQKLTMEQAVARYGKDYIKRGRGLGACPTEDEVREASRQPPPDEYPIALIYPQQGLYVTVNSDNMVIEVGYLADCPSFRL
jgi:hypothetical protein